MPMHDWTRASAGTFHAFHNAWITHLQEALNAGLLPKPYYALGEQQAGEVGPDVLALKATQTVQAAGESYAIDSPESTPSGTLLSALDSPPVVRFTQIADDESQFYLLRQRAVTIRHASQDEVVALVEIISRANRHSLQALSDFADKVINALRVGIHVVVIDAFPPGRHDPDGIHGFIWNRLLAGDFEADAKLPLTLVAYTAGHPIQAWVEPLAVGTSLASMPLFLTREQYISLPLEETYQRAWNGLPARWQNVITGEESN